MPDIALDNLQLILTLIVPGFVAVRVYDLLIPAERRDFSKMIIDVFAYSVFIFPLIAWPLYSLQVNGFPIDRPLAYIYVYVGLILVVPTALSSIVVFLRKKGWFPSLPHPSPTAWDFIFSQEKAFWLIFHLKDGRRIGGFFAEKSFASAYPREQAVYVEELWSLGEDGTFSSKIDRNAGGLIRRADCDIVEFFTVLEESRHEREEQ